MCGEMLVWEAQIVEFTSYPLFVSRCPAKWRGGHGGILPTGLFQGRLRTLN
jgi:hypothetical protein